MLQIIGLVSLAIVAWATNYYWFEFHGFDATASTHWKWIFNYFRDYSEAPTWFFKSLAVSFAAWFGMMLAANLIAVRIGGSTKFGDYDSKNLRGSAHWASKKEINGTGLVRKTGTVVGALKKPFPPKLLRHDGPEHILFEAPTRGGKGISLILYNLLTWAGSSIVLDIKGENWLKSSYGRRLLGNAIFAFEPTAEECLTRYNPLTEIRIGTDHEIADTQNIATMLIDPEGKGLKDFWMKAGYAWLAATILHVLYLVKAKKNRCASLRDVSLFLAPSDIDFETLLQEMIDFEHGRETVNDFVRASAAEILNSAPQQRSGVHESAKTELQIFRDPIIARNTAVSDFRINDLMNGEKPATLYLIIPPRHISRLKPLVRVLVNQLLNTLMENEKHGKTPYKHRMLLMLDEFAAMGKMEIFETALAYMASYGLKAFIVVQSRLQIFKHYGKENGIIANCHIQACLTPNDDTTAELYQKLCGETTVIRKHKDRNRKALSITGNVSERQTEEKRWLLTADEARRLRKPQMSRKKGEETRVTGPGEMLLLVSGTAPIRCEMPLYFKDKELARLSKQAPVVDGVSDVSNTVENLTAPTKTPVADDADQHAVSSSASSIREVANQTLKLEDEHV